MNWVDWIVYGASAAIAFYATKQLLGNEVESLLSKKS